MIFRKSSTPEAPEPAPAPREEPGSKKGRPTRTRKEAEAARRRPLVVSDRKEARRRSRMKANEQRAREQQALATGDTANMPLQHRGPERELVRDLVDSRRNIAEYFFPIALIFMVVALVLPLVNPELYTTVSLGMIIVLWGGIALCVIDGFLIRRHLRREITGRFGEVQRGLVGYGIMRAIQIRRFRLPKPQIKHGERPQRER